MQDISDYMQCICVFHGMISTILACLQTLGPLEASLLLPAVLLIMCLGYV